MRTLFQGIFAVSVLTVVLVAQSMPTANYKLSGTVINSVTGEPVRRALISFGPRSALTDGDGRFELDRLPDMAGTIRAHKPGFFSAVEVMQSSFGMQNVQVSENTPPVTVKLTPEGVITGRIDFNGAPLEGIPLKLVASRVADGRRRWNPEGNATTDEDGIFRLANLLPGLYYVVAGPQWDPNTLPPGKWKHIEGYPEVLYPGVADISAATPVQVAAGQQLNADFSVKPVPVFDVSGTATGFAAAQGLNLQFVTSNGDAQSFAFQFNADTGQFHAKVPRGSYVMRAVGPSMDEFPLTAELPVDINGDMKGIQLVLTPKPAVPVNVQVVPTASKHSSSNRSSATAARSLNAHVSSIGPSLSAEDFYAQFEGAGRDAKLVVRNLNPGRYFFEAIPNSDWYVASAQCGDADLLREPLDVPTGGRVSPIEVQLRNDGASFTASVTSAGVPTAAWVLLIPSRSPRAAKAQYQAQGQEAGMRNLAPGDYFAVALDRIDGLEYTNLEAFSDYLSRATHVTLEPEQEMKLNLELVHAQK
jgi:hypothetical protein